MTRRRPSLTMMPVAGHNRGPVLCLISVLVALCHGSCPVSTVGGQCDAGWCQFDGRCYFFSDLAVDGIDQYASWTDAKQTCIDHGATLATIKTQAQQDFMQSCVSSTSEYFWFGLNDLKTENTFVWEDGSQLTYSNWKSSNPDNYNGQDCVLLIGGSGLWNDKACGESRNYICQKNINVPTTEATTTTTSTTVPTTNAPTTTPPTTDPPTTPAPTTDPPTTPAPTTDPPTTPAPTTEAPTTPAPTTDPQTTPAPTTYPPTTPAPTTYPPTTPAPTTQASTPTPSTPAPLTPTAPASSPPSLSNCTCTDATGSPTIPGTMTLDQFKVMLVKQTKDELTLNASSLARSRAKKTSAPDSRLSSQMAGGVAIGVIAVVGLLTVLPDLLTLVRYCTNAASQKKSPKIGSSGREERA